MPLISKNASLSTVKLGRRNRKDRKTDLNQRGSSGGL